MNSRVWTLFCFETRNCPCNPIYLPQLASSFSHCLCSYAIKKKDEIERVAKANRWGIGRTLHKPWQWTLLFFIQYFISYLFCVPNIIWMFRYLSWDVIEESISCFGYICCTYFAMVWSCWVHLCCKQRDESAWCGCFDHIKSPCLLLIIST